MSRRTYSSSNSWAQNISAIIHRTEANIASIRQEAPSTFVSPSSPYTTQNPATQRVYHYAPQIGYSGGRWAQPVIHTHQRCYTPTIKGMSHIQDNCPECANPMTEMSGQGGSGGAHHNRSYFTLQQQHSRPFTERPEELDSASHVMNDLVQIYVRNVIESEIDPRARSVASFKNENLMEETGDHSADKTPLKGILRQSAFSERAAAQSNLESMAEIFNKLQDLKYEQQSVVDKYEIGQKGLRNEILDLRNDIELNQLQKIEDKISDMRTDIKKEVRGVENKMIALERTMTELRMDIDSKLDTEFHRALADFQAKSGEERIKLRRDILDVMEDKVGNTEQKHLLSSKDHENANTQLKQRIKKLEESMAEQVQENHRSAMDKIDMIRVEMETKGIKEATTITSEKEETMNEIEALKREIARLNKKIANPKPVRDELAVSKMEDFEERLLALERDHLKREKVIKNQANQTEKQLRNLIEQQTHRIAELENRNESRETPPQKNVVLPPRLEQTPNLRVSPLKDKSQRKKKPDPLKVMDEDEFDQPQGMGGDIFDEPEVKGGDVFDEPNQVDQLQRRTIFSKPKTNAEQSRGIYNVPEESFGFQESEEQQDNIAMVESGAQEDGFQFNQKPVEVHLESKDNQPANVETSQSKPEKKEVKEEQKREKSETEEEESKDQEWDFEKEFDDIFENNSPDRKSSKFNRVKIDEDQPKKIEPHQQTGEEEIQKGEIKQEPVKREEIKASGALELNSDFDDTDEENEMKNPLESGILGKPTDRLEDIGTSEIHISELADDDQDNGEKLRDEEDAVIQESKQLVQGIHQRYESGEQEEEEPEEQKRDNGKAVKVQGQLDFDTDEGDQAEEEEDLLGAEGVELEVTPLYEERKSHALKEEDSTHLEPDCSQMVSDIDEWVSVVDVKSSRNQLVTPKTSPPQAQKSEPKSVKFQGALEAGSSIDEEDSKFDPEMDATMSWGDLDRRDSELEQTQSHIQEDEEAMGEVAKHILQEEVAAILQIVEARRKF